MFNIRNSKVLTEVGAAIGNLGEVIRGKPSMAEIVDEAFHRQLERIERLQLPKQSEIAKPDGDIVDATWKEVDE